MVEFTSETTHMHTIDDMKKELVEARRRGKSSEVADLHYLIDHATARPLQESAEYVRELKAVRNRQAGRRYQRRFRHGRSARDYRGGSATFPVGSLVRAPDGIVFAVTGYVNGAAMGRKDDGSGVTCPFDLLTLVSEGAEGAESTAPASCARCDELYHAVWDYLEG